MTDRQKMMKRVQMYHFACIEANLFLDTHPKNTQALEYFKKMNRMYEQAKREYAAKYGMITTGDISDEAAEWEWIKAPWPWMADSEVEK